MKEIAGLLLGAGILLAGCTPMQVTDSDSRMEPRADSESLSNRCDQLQPDQALVVQLANDMVAQGRLHAALAHLEQLPNTLPEVRLHKANIQRKLGDPRAEALYESLLDGCLSAEAYHGMGQIAAARQDYVEALKSLQKAARLAPANYRIRNDLGYVYLHLRKPDKARFEFLTAVELGVDDPMPLQNLLTLLIYEDHWKEASALLKEKKVTPRQYQQAEERARALDLEDRLNSGHYGESRSAGAGTE